MEPIAVMEISLDAKVAFLSRPESYPEISQSVECRETHMSWVFLTDAYAYKLKKPVRTAFLDFSTPEARRINCEREVRLNRRLAGDIYLGVRTLSSDPRGNLRLDGRGTKVDWLVQMRRMPAERNLEVLIAAGQIAKADMLPLAERLCTFYRAAAPVVMNPERYLHGFEAATRENHATLVRPEFGLSASLVSDVAGTLSDFLATHGIALEQRASRLVDAHGDLRPEHVYLTSPPVVLDCLEFNRDLRLLDPANELAYLAMECRRIGAPFVQGWLFDAYRARTGDDPRQEIVRFYEWWNAFLRARISIQHLDKPQAPDRPKWIARANQYLRLALDGREQFAR